MGWGTYINGEAGRACAPPSRLLDTMCLGSSLLRLGRASRETAEKWAGLLVHPFSHRKCLMSLRHHYYGWTDSLPEPPRRLGATPSAEPRVQKIPAHILDEIWACSAHLPLSVPFRGGPSTRSFLPPMLLLKRVASHGLLFRQRLLTCCGVRQRLKERTYDYTDLARVPFLRRQR